MDLKNAVTHLTSLVTTVRTELGTPIVVEATEFEYLASMAAYTEIVLQQAEAFATLGTAGDRFFFAAASAARSALEAAIKAAWIAKPKTALNKEGRWLGLQESMVKSHRDFAKDLAEADPTLDESAAPIRQLHDLLKSRTIAGKAIPIEPKPKSTEAMMQDIDCKKMYAVYRELCEIVHVGPEMVVRYKDGTEQFGAGKIAVYPRILETDWLIPCLTIGWSVSASSMATLAEIGADPKCLVRIHNAQVAYDSVVRS